VKDAAVIAVGEGANVRLVAYVVGPPDKSSSQVIRAAIAQRLPSHMVPSQVVILDSLPLTPRGKLDRNALTALQPGETPATWSRPPSNAVERALVQIWQKCLNLPEIGVEDDFYEIGGTSLQAFLIFAGIAQTLGRDLPPAIMLEASTIAKQAKLLQDRVSPRNISKLIACRDHGSRSALFVLPAAFGDIGYARELARHLKCDRPVFGLRPPALDGTESIPKTIEAIAANYIAEIRTAQPKGPYFLAGHSIGGRIAFEMAQQLVRQGEAVDFLGLIDTFETSAPKRRETAAPRVARHVRELRQRTFREMASYIGMRAAKNLGYGLAVVRLAALERLPKAIGSQLIKPPSYMMRPDLYRNINRQASRRYTSQPYVGSITLFSAKGSSDFHRKYWQPLALGGLTVTEIPAGHTGIVWPPYSALLAEGFDACLDRAPR
jgi:thioesterase domain-containing protein